MGADVYLPGFLKTGQLKSCFFASTVRMIAKKNTTGWVLVFLSSLSPSCFFSLWHHSDLSRGHKTSDLVSFTKSAHIE